ncbi:hypothetical protein K469DRAFT_715369 [Zopfia rhizophila CBS 207.26]|uniref:Uncharacterized protein n=1 Tax=Zopfia rhizophila CBS 207.26 TaxID=1314779 RepID=A0A6A6ENZ0_9PEZI|nr:hypothetical protein K469DRAFT_715369 [Zopfia rhizophila CBS 207.26]
MNNLPNTNTNSTMDSGWTRGPVCGIENCRSREYEEAEDGYFYCRNGHRRGDILVTGEDDEDFNPNVKRQRAKKEESEKVYQYFRGQRAFDLFLKCFQLILRRQVWFLVHEKGLPAEFEDVVKDLWALRILQLEDQISDISSHDDAQSQVFSTASESESEPEKETVRSLRRGQRLNTTPRLLDSVALCYLGIVTLRLPITPGDLHSWITDGKMVYVRAIKSLSADMRDRLPANYHAILDPNAVLKLERFYNVTIDLTTSYEKEHGVTWPALNHPLLLYRYLKELALPLEIYDATTRLAIYLKYTFTWPSTRKGRVGIRELPEAQLIACLVVCVKLMYPFDGPRRYPKTAAEPAATAIDWPKWDKHISSAKEGAGDLAKYMPDEFLTLKEKEVFSMSGDQLDQYLNWYRDTFIEDDTLRTEKNSDFQNSIYKMFPIDGEAKSDLGQEDSAEAENMKKLDIIRAVHADMRPVRIIEEGEENADTFRPGSKYKHYRKEKDLPTYARRFYEEAARVAGLSLDMLIMAVFFTEKKMQKWIETQRKQDEI